MPYLEKDLTADFSKWRRKSPYAKGLDFSFNVEFKLKRDKKKLDLVRDFQPQQIPMLAKSSTGCLYHKLSDMGRGLKPFDAFQSCRVLSFVGVMWHKARHPKILYLIDVRDLVRRMDTGDYKLDELTAKDMATYTLNLSNS